MTWERMVYQREHFPPKHLSIEVTVIGKEPGPNPIYLVKFALDEVLDPKSPTLEKDLLYDLNIIQENTDAADVFPTNATLEQYRTTLTVRREILPPGNRERNVSIIIRDTPDLPPELMSLIA